MDSPAFHQAAESPFTKVVGADPQAGLDYHRVGRVMAYIADHWAEQPTLGELAAVAGLSEAHFQRLFTRWAGVSPKQFLARTTLTHAKDRLQSQASLLDTAYDVGLSGPGRLHDLFVVYEAMTPGSYKKAGQGLAIGYGWHPSPFGDCLLMATEQGLCGLAFVDHRGHEGCFADMAARWPDAHFTEDPTATAGYAARIFPPAVGVDDLPLPPLKLFLKGSPFQIKVWEGLMALPYGAMVTYGDLAQNIGVNSQAARAVGTAVGANPISWLIPCHRVIRQSGMLGGYRWGLPRKVAMLGWEQAALPACKPTILKAG